MRGFFCSVLSAPLIDVLKLLLYYFIFFCFFFFHFVVFRRPPSVVVARRDRRGWEPIEIGFCVLASCLRSGAPIGVFPSSLLVLARVVVFLPSERREHFWVICVELLGHLKGMPDVPLFVWFFGCVYVGFASRWPFKKRRAFALCQPRVNFGALVALRCFCLSRRTYVHTLDIFFSLGSRFALLAGCVTYCTHGLRRSSYYVNTLPPVDFWAVRLAVLFGFVPCTG